MTFKFKGFEKVVIAVVAQNIIKQILTVNFWVGFIGWYQIFKWIKPYIGGM